MSKPFTIEDVRKSPVAGINTHLFDSASLRAKKKSKYLNKKIIVNGITFDSKKEAGRYNELKMLQAAREIIDLRLQVPFQLSVCKYIADFCYYTKAGAYVVEDVKSRYTRKLAVYRLKKKLMKAEFDIEINEV